LAFHVGEPEDEVLSDINVTPLVDVMLVLLIIFMIATPMLHQGVEVALPEVTSESLPLRDQDPMVLTVTNDETVFVKDDPIHPSQLVERLTPLLAGREDQTVFLRGDRDARYEAVLRVIELLDQAGIHRVALVTEPAPARRRR
jgi:biopolymer transport protein TolR